MDKEKKKKYISKHTALEKLQKYCAYQDRCHKEVRSKLLDLGLYGDELEQVIAELITDNFLNEERFAQSYARGKFRIKHWGRRKIIQELKLRKLSAYCIKKGMAEIDEEEYEKKLHHLLEKKNNILKEKNIYIRRKKLFDYAYRKGYESFLIQNCIQLLTTNK